MEGAEYYTKECRKLFELRMSLLPYLYGAYVDYYRTGKPLEVIKGNNLRYSFSGI